MHAARLRKKRYPDHLLIFIRINQIRLAGVNYETLDYRQMSNDYVIALQQCHTRNRYLHEQQQAGFRQTFKIDLRELLEGHRERRDP